MPIEHGYQEEDFCKSEITPSEAFSCLGRRGEKRRVAITL
jgi:hypothetical protein